jgi:hypothetical protein
MSASVLAETRRFDFPADLAEHCMSALRERGEEGLELFIALTATVDPETHAVRLRRALVPRQICHVTPEGLLVTIEGDAIYGLNRECYEAGELLAAQIHAHPGRAYHSGADDQLALVRLPGGLSIVVPDFASGRLDPRAWSVHQLRHDGRWGRLSHKIDLRLS